MRTVFQLVTTIVLCLALQFASACPPQRGVALQVLGSGGPVADDGRASSAYLVWMNGQSRFMIDAGGGAFLRFGEAGGNFEQLELIGLSHFHTDHSADLPALLKSGYFSSRRRPLIVSGPGENRPFPGLQAFMRSMLDAKSGAYGYLSGYLDGSGGLPHIVQFELAHDADASVLVASHPDGEWRVDAMAVPHGIVPTLAYRLQVGDTRIVLGGDQNGDDADFVDFAAEADLLVMHMPVPEGIEGVGRRLHAPPGVVGEIADKAGVGKLVLSHFMARSLRDLDDNLAAVRAHYPGPIVVAEDLDCILPGRKPQDGAGP